jgi:hypothetical protein
MDYAALRTLIETHPTHGSETDEALQSWVSEEVVSVDKTTLSNEEILAVILNNRSEFTALAEGDKQIVRDILYVGTSVPTASGEPARDTLVAIYGGGSATITELAASISQMVSRAVAAGIIGKVRVGDIAIARTWS